MNICNYNFEGPFASTEYIKNQSGAYVILDKNSEGYNILDCGESEAIKNRIENHDRSDCWKRNAKGKIVFCVFYCSEQKRMQVESEIRKKYNPPCGER